MERRPISESIFDGKQYIIPLAEVAFVEKSALSDEVCVVMRGAQHPIAADGHYVSGYGRADCPYLNGEEKAEFMRAWLYYRYEVDGPFKEVDSND